MALFRQLLTARQSIIIDDIETLQPQISSKEEDITALKDRLDTEVAKKCFTITDDKPYQPTQHEQRHIGVKSKNRE